MRDQDKVRHLFLNTQFVLGPCHSDVRGLLHRRVNVTAGQFSRLNLSHYLGREAEGEDNQDAENAHPIPPPFIEQ